MSNKGKQAIFSPCTSDIHCVKMLPHISNTNTPDFHLLNLSVRWYADKALHLYYFLWLFRLSYGRQGNAIFSSFTCEETEFGAIKEPAQRCNCCSKPEVTPSRQAHLTTEWWGLRVEHLWLVTSQETGGPWERGLVWVLVLELVIRRANGILSEMHCPLASPPIPISWMSRAGPAWGRQWTQEVFTEMAESISRWMSSRRIERCH